MSSTLSNLGGCGCNPSPSPLAPGSMTVVPAGSMVVQAPCGEGCAPPSSAQLSPVQQGGGESSCESYRNPCVTNSFVAPPLGKAGSFFAACASAWAMPGLQLYFPGLGYLEILGSSGNVITYRNLTIEPGTEILAGTCFHHDAPPAQTVETGGDDGEITASTTLDALYGEEGNARKKILPVNGMMLYACGGKWQRRQAGLMFYPLPAPVQLYAYSSSVQNQAQTITLPTPPAVPSCSLGLFARLRSWLRITGSSGQTPDVSLLVNTVELTRSQRTTGGGVYNHGSGDVRLSALGATTLDLVLNRNNNAGGSTLQAALWIDGYLY